MNANARHRFRAVDSLPKGQKVHANYCISNVPSAIRETFPEAEDDANRRPLARADNARPLFPESTEIFRDESFIGTALHPIYSSDLATSDFASSRMSKAANGQSFETGEELFDCLQ
jgi:hypothetical protein